RNRIWPSVCAVLAFVGSSVVTAHPAAATTPPVDAPPGSATTYQMNALHDGHSTDELSFPLGQKWSHDFGAQVRVSYPLVVSGRVFVAASKTASPLGVNLWAFDASDGTVLWGPSAVGAPWFGYGPTSAIAGLAADGANLYVLTEEGFLQAFDQETGAPGWTTKLPVQWSFTSPPTVHGGEVYVGGAG